MPSLPSCLPGLFCPSFGSLLQYLFLGEACPKYSRSVPSSLTLSPHVFTACKYDTLLGCCGFSLTQGRAPCRVFVLQHLEPCLRRAGPQPTAADSAGAEGAALPARSDRGCRLPCPDGPARPGFPGGIDALIDSGFLPGQGGQDSTWPHSCSREEVSVPGQQPARLLGKAEATRTTFSPPGFGGAGTGASGQRGAVGWGMRPPRCHCHRSKEEGGVQGLPRPHFQSSLARYFNGAYSLLCEGRAWMPASPGWNFCHSRPPTVQRSKQRLPEGQGLLGDILGQWQAREMNPDLLTPNSSFLLFILNQLSPCPPRAWGTDWLILAISPPETPLSLGVRPLPRKDCSDCPLEWRRRPRDGRKWGGPTVYFLETWLVKLEHII